MILIAYQGIKGSNSEEAARQLAEKNQFKEYTLLPLVSSFNVLDSVQTGIVNYGVVAVSNNTGGMVRESAMSLSVMKLKLLDSITLPIHHFLYVKHNGITKDAIQKITTHRQALVQCQETLNEKFPNIELSTDEDTATAARKLRLGLLEETTAVLCRKNAGDFNHLTLMQSHLEDRPDNTTDFEMYGR